MLGGSVTLSKNATPDDVVYTQITGGEYKTIRKDVSGTYADNQLLTVSQQYNESTGVRRTLVRLDRTPDPTATLPEPRVMSAYLVFDFEDQDHPDAIADMTELGYQLQMFLSGGHFPKVLNGEH